VKLAQTQLKSDPGCRTGAGRGLTQAVTELFFGIIPTTSNVGQKTTTLGPMLRPYFNPAAFAKPPLYTFGTIGRMSAG
jgi:hypothetical protein